jgi:hypothetical protein
MWKMNDVYVGQNGGEWPDPFIPVTWAQYYIKRFSQTPTGVTVTDGSSHQAGQSIGLYTGWGLGSNSGTNALSFSLTQSGNTTGYKMNKVALGTSNGWWSNSSSIAPTWMAKIYSGTALNSANIIYDAGFVYPGTPQGSNVTGSNYATTAHGVPYDSYFFLDLPEPATAYGGSAALPLLTFGNWYTIAYSYRVSPSASVAYIQYNYSTSQAITLSTGNSITQSISSSTFGLDSAPFNTDEGTSQYSGQLAPVLAYEFQV